MNVTVHPDGGVEDVIKDVLRVRTVHNVSNLACALTVPHVITSVVPVHVHLVGGVPSVINPALTVIMV